MGSNHVEVTEANFENEVLKSDIPVLVDFWAVWCGPCRAIAPTLDQIAEEYKGKLKVGKLNVDENQNLATRYHITGIPTLLIFKGGEVAQQIVGAVPKAKIVSALSSVL